MATLRPASGPSTSPSGTQMHPASPNTASQSPSPASGYTSLGSPSTTATSTATASLPSNDEVEAIIKQATSTRPTPDGRPPPGKDTRTQLFAGNLPYRVRWQDLKDLFRRAGTVLRADVSLSPDNRSRGYGTVLLASAEDAGRAVDMFNGYSWQGRVLEVRLDRLGAVPGVEMDVAAATVSMNVGAGMGVGMGGIPGMVNVNGLGVGMGALGGMGGMNGMGGVGVGAALNGLHVPSPHPAMSFVTQQLTGGGNAGAGTSPALPSTSGPNALGGALSGTHPPASPLNPLNSGSLALHVQQQQQEREREREEYGAGAGLGSIGSVPGMGSVSGAPTRPGTSGLGIDSYLSALGRGAEWERERPRSNLGMRSLFVGNLPFHCQWQDLKDLFRQAGTILRADVSLGPDGRSRGFGTVSFANEIDAERAVAMFNGFDYNGRTLKVHYDKFSAQSPLLSNMGAASSHPSTLTTPVQPNATSTQQALMQAVQLQQLVSGQTYERYGSFSSFGPGADYNSSYGCAVNSNNGNGIVGGGPTQEQTKTLGASLQALHDSLQAQSGSGAGSGNESAGATSGGSPVSPFNYFMGSSPSLAERRQKIPAPIGAASASASRPGSGGGLASSQGQNEPLSIETALETAVGRTNSFDKASPVTRRPAGQSLPASSASVPTASKEEEVREKKKSSMSAAFVPTLSSTSTSTSNSNSSSIPSTSAHTPSASSTSPRTSHPAHPGPIALPPPPSAGTFPLYSPHHHPMSPMGHPMSPIYPGYAPYGAMSPMYSLPPHMHAHNMTPHGLPPITPSMPSFSFVPQPSPAAPAGGSSAIPPTPALEGGDGYAPPVLPAHDAGQQGPGSMGMMIGMMSPPMHMAHHVPHHVFQPFTPGATMSPGAFYGRPNGGASGSFMNHAVGSPVLIHPPFGFPIPGSQPGSPYYPPNPNGANGSGGTYGEEPSGYFPPVGPPPQQMRHEGYFPPVPALGSSGLANEILKNGSTINVESPEDRPPHERNDSGSAPTSSEDGPEDDSADADRARSSSSGATSWRSSEENGVGLTLNGIASDMASVRLGSPPEALSASYAVAADKSKGVQRAESASSVDEVFGGYPAARHFSMGSENARRPAVLQKTQSDETGQHNRMNADGTTTSS